jgi:hypothetical protein
MLIEFCNTDGTVLSEKQLHLTEAEHLEYLLKQFRENGWLPTTRRTDDGEIVITMVVPAEPPSGDDDYGLVCEPIDILHPQDHGYEDQIKRTRRLYTGYAMGDAATEDRVAISIATTNTNLHSVFPDQHSAGLLLTADEVRDLIGHLEGDLKSIEGQQD